jgi:hypothetical protein
MKILVDVCRFVEDISRLVGRSIGRQVGLSVGR